MFEYRAGSTYIQESNLLCLRFFFLHFYEMFAHGVVMSMLFISFSNMLYVSVSVNVVNVGN